MSLIASVKLIQYLRWVVACTSVHLLEQYMNVHELLQAHVQYMISIYMYMYMYFTYMYA